MNTVLATYRENGTHVSPIRVNRSEKLLRVGLYTRKRGGKSSSSSIGLKALRMT